MSLALELKKDDDEVAAWSIDKLMRWSEFFKRKNKREAEAMEKARKEAERNAKKGRR